MTDRASTTEDRLFQVFNEIAIINQLATTRFERVMPAGMTIAQFSVLNHFMRLGGRKRPTDLARAFQVTKATMTSTLKRMEAKGLVAIVGDEEDGRGRLVDITPAGRAMRDDCIARVGPELADIAAMLRPGHLDELVRPLAEMRAKLDAAR